MRRQPKIENELRFLYDHQADVLSICAGQSIQTDSVPLDENVILHVDPASQAIVGFSIIDFVKQFANAESPRAIPIVATFERVKKSSLRGKRKNKK